LWRAVAIGEARNIQQSLGKFGLGPSDVVHAIPIIARSFLELRSRRRIIYVWVWLPFEFVVTVLTFGIYYLELAAFPEFRTGSSLHLLPAFGSIGYIYIIMVLFFFWPFIILIQSIGRRQRFAVTMYTSHRLTIYDYLSNCNVQLIIMALVSVIALVSTWLSTISWRDTLFITVGAAFGSLWAGVMLYGGWRIYSIVELIVIPPEIIIMRTIADAILAVSATKTRMARSFRAIKFITYNISIAANLLEGPMLRQLAHGDKAVEEILRPQLEMFAAGLRRNLLLLVTPTATSVEELIRSLGHALVGAATGNFQFASPDALAPTVAGPLWQDRVVGLLRRLSLALIPGLAVIVAIRGG